MGNTQCKCGSNPKNYNVGKDDNICICLKNPKECQHYAHHCICSDNRKNCKVKCHTCVCGITMLSLSI